MKKPFIAVTPSYHSKEQITYVKYTYLKALKAAGAIPFTISLYSEGEDLKQILSMADGFLFTGGPDIHPFHYNQEGHKNCGEICDERDRLELSLLPLAMKTGKPVLGICRGIQLLNVALGGTLWQDIDSQVSSPFPLAHSQTFDYRLPSHTVTVNPDSLLSSVLDCCEIKVNSMHHQAIRDLAPGLKAAGYSEDGIIEAVEHPGCPFFLGVQWHPEYMWETQPAMARMFHAFVNACNPS